MHCPGQRRRAPQQGAFDVPSNLDGKSGSAALARVVARLTCTVAGRCVSSIDQDEATSGRLLEVRNMRAQHLPDQRKDAPVHPRHGRLADSEQITHSGLTQILPDVHQRDDEHDTGPRPEATVAFCCRGRSAKFEQQAPRSGQRQAP